MEQVLKNVNTCGFGRRRTRFGDNLGPTDSNFDSFFKNGTANSSNLTKSASSCLSGLYGQQTLTRFGKKKFIKEISFEKKGTKGSFTRWCKSHGYPKVTNACIKRGKKSNSVVTRKRAIFAQNIKKGRNSTLKDNLKDIKYLKRK